MSLTLALLQYLPHDLDVEANQSKGVQLCREAKSLGADIALFPEMWSIGYRFFDAQVPGSRESWQKLAVGSDGPFIQSFRDLACELDMAIAITTLEEWADRPRNTVSLIDRHGEIRLVYAKVHTCEWGGEAALTPGDGFPVCTLDTAGGEVQVGAMICYDREFPESARALMLGGAEIILTPNACTLETHRLGQFKTRAYENMVALAMTNYPAPHCNGHSIAVDPICFTADEASRDTVRLEAGEEEGTFLAEFDLEAIREYRRKNVWGNAFRRPGNYAALTAMEVSPPFIRRDATR